MDTERSKQKQASPLLELEVIFAAELFSKLGQADRERVISLIKALLSQK